LSQLISRGVLKNFIFQAREFSWPVYSPLKYCYNGFVQITIAKNAGFCEGVERAYNIALKQIQSGKAVYMLGNLVHNARVIRRLKNLGVKSVNNVSEIPQDSNGILLISAHGVAPQIYEEAKSKNLKIVDTTCSWVKKAQRIAQRLSHENRLVIIVGDKGHAEVKGLVGWSGGKALVIEKPEDVEKLTLSPEIKVGILAQTTQSENNYNRIIAEIKKRGSDLKEFNTICGATSKRQYEAVDLARKVDLMLIIGDKMSANTKRLAELCSATGTLTYQIQTAEELNPKWFAKTRKIGISAGASTPQEVINEVVANLQARG
jgi:small subunit ribosomal protein S1